MQEAENPDDIVLRTRERERVVWIRTQAFAAFLAVIALWTLAVCCYRSNTERFDSRPPSELVVDLNDATLAELNLLPGVGDKLASDILKYREEIGSFHSVDELMNIRGIKEGRLLSLKKYVTVGSKQKLAK